MRPSNANLLSLSCLFHTAGDRFEVNEIGKEKTEDKVMLAQEELHKSTLVHFTLSTGYSVH